MKIAKDFFKHVPIEKQQAIFNKLKQFTTAILEAKVFHSIPKGFWIRKIAGTNIYKFRVNSGDRILFTFNEDQTVTYLSFEVHDRQIQAAKRKKETQLVNFIVNQTPYEEDEQDYIIDKYALEELSNKLRIIGQHEVMEDEYISLLFDDDQLFNSEDVFTLEQFNCFQINQSLTIILGCAGSGKTNIALRRLKLHEELGIHTIYATHSTYLMNAANELFVKKYKHPTQIEFLSWQQLLEKVLGKSYTVISRTDFTIWFEQNITLALEENDAYIEITSFIKGTGRNKMLSQEQYLQLSSTLTKQQKKQFYFLATMYENWLSKNQYVDLNDLAYEVIHSNSKAIPPIIFDEMQELTEKQVNALLKIMREPENSLLLGDPFQAIHNANFQLVPIKIFLKERQIRTKVHTIYKNFRSGEEVIRFLNYLKGKDTQLESSYEIAIRKTVSPQKVIHATIPKKYVELLNNDADAIVIVSNEIERQKHLNNGLKRVFLFSEIQGLQYKKVYCYNVLQSFEQAITKKSHLINLYLHGVYVAASRTTNELYFIESDELPSFQNFQMDSTLFETIFETSQKSTKEHWLKEGKKLELLGNFTQAIHAYEQAGELQAIKRCEKILGRKLNFEHLKNYEMILAFEFNVDHAKKIEIVLEILEREGLTFQGQMTAYRSQTSGILVNDPFYIDEEMSIKDVSELIFKLSSYSYAKLDSIFICGVLYENNIPVKISNKYGQKENDIVFRNNLGRYQMYLAKLDFERSTLRKQRNFDKQIYGKAGKIIGEYDLDRLIVKNNKNTADDFLTDIFGK